MSFPNHFLTMNSNNAPLHYPMKPVGIFWDIENCPVPKINNASSVIHFIRSFFVVNRLHHREFDFLVACDVTRINKTISDEINKAGGVTLAHVNGNSKNAADEKLRESMRKFVDTHGSTTPTLVLISGDIDFVSDLRGYQTRLGCSIIVIHGVNSSQHFKTGWNEIYSFDTFLMMMGGTASPSLVAPASGKQGPIKANNFQKNNSQKPQNNGPRPQKPNQGNYQGRQSQGEMTNDNKKKTDNNQHKGQGSGGMDRKQNANKTGFNGAQGGPHASNVGSTSGGGNPNFQKKKPQQQRMNIADEGSGFNGAYGNNAIAGGSSGSEKAAFQKKKPPQQQRMNSVDEGFVVLDKMPFGNAPSKQAKEPKEKQEYILMVTGLPGKLDYRILKDNLQAKASQVKGSVKFVKNGQGFISFKKKEHADNAIALFNGMDVYGKKLNVNYCQKIPFDNRDNQEAEKQEDANLDELVKAVGEGIGTLFAKKKNSECCIQ